MAIRFTEFYPEVGAAFHINVKDILYSGKSPYQKIDVIETEHFGRILIIDNFIMLTERDEFVYHEMIAQVPMFVHPAPKNVLIIGGGDGGTVREVLKHQEVEHIDLVDIDKVVSEVCIDYFPQLASGLLSERVNCKFEDGVAYVKNTDQKYDIIIVDSTDPVSVGEGLFNIEFYRNCFNILKEQGVLVNQAESPAFTPIWVSGIAGKLKQVFPNVHFYQAHIPTYPSGHWLFGFASKTLHPLKDFQEDRYHKNQLKLNYYNSDIHYAAFALPNFVRELVETV